MPGHRKTFTLSITALILGVGVSLVHADPAAKALLTRAHSDWADQEYEKVVTAADAALKRPRLSRALRVDALWLKGSAHTVLGRFAFAKQSFTRLIQVNPRFRPPDKTSPRIGNVFNRAREASETALKERLGADLKAMKLNVFLPRKARGGLALPVTVTLHDPKRLAKDVLIFYRRHGTRSYSRLSAATRATKMSIRIPAVFTASSNAYQLDVYVEVLHKSGVALKRHASEVRPLTLAMGPGHVPRPKPLYKKWWFWASTAALAIAVPLLVDQAIDVGPQRVTGTRN